jgi:hypothetical protein
MAPVVVEPPQSVTFEEMDLEEKSDCNYFDKNMHPKFQQFRKAREGAPIANLEHRYKIFAVSLLLRLVGSFDGQVW